MHSNDRSTPIHLPRRTLASLLMALCLIGPVACDDSATQTEATSDAAAADAAGHAPSTSTPPSQDTPPPPAVATADVPVYDLAGIEPQVIEAIENARGAVLADPTSGEAWWKLASVLDAHSLFDEAIPAYRRAIDLEPKSFKMLYNFAAALELQGSTTAESLDMFRQATEIQPEYAPAWMRLGDALTARGKLDEAITAYQRAIEVDPDLFRAVRSLGQTYLNIGATEEARTFLMALVAKAPLDGPTNAAVAQLLMLDGDEAGADAASTIAAESTDHLLFTDPERRVVLDQGISTFLCRKRASRALEFEQFAEAIPDLQILVTNDPGNAAVHYQLGYAAFRVGDVDLAEEHLTQAVMLNETDPAPHVELAALMSVRGRHDVAVDHYRTALQLAPNNLPVNWRLASSLAQNGQVAEALAQFQTASVLAPGNATGHLNWGMALYSQGRLDDAIVRFSEAVQFEPTYVRAHCNLGVALQQAGQEDQAIRHFRTAAKLDPNCMAVGRLADLGVSVDGE